MVLHYLETDCHAQATTAAELIVNSDQSAQQPERKKSRLMQFKAIQAIAAFANKSALQEIHEYIKNPLIAELKYFGLQICF
jgi:hypothetical protein